MGNDLRCALAPGPLRMMRMMPRPALQRDLQPDVHCRTNRLQCVRTCAVKFCRLSFGMLRRKIITFGDPFVQGPTRPPTGNKTARPTTEKTPEPLCICCVRLAAVCWARWGRICSIRLIMFHGANVQLVWQEVRLLRFKKVLDTRT